MSFWTDDDVWEYIHKYNIPYCKVYDMGYVRTGCIFCMFGVHLDPEPNRFQRLQKTHPKLWRYCMRSWDKGGLGMREVLEYMRPASMVGQTADRITSSMIGPMRR